MPASSLSNTRAGPRCSRRPWPTSFTTQPSGERLPRRIASPPVGLSGRSTGRITSCPGCSFASATSSPIVLPLTVRHSPFSNSAPARMCPSNFVPPARKKSVAMKRPAGFRSHSTGVREQMSIDFVERETAAPTRWRWRADAAQHSSSRPKPPRRSWRSSAPRRS